MRAPIRLLVVTLAWLLWGAGLAAAAPRLVVGPVQGDPKVAIPAQVAAALCKTLTCVRWSEVSAGREPSQAKVQRLQVDGLLVGAITREAGGAVAALTLLDGALQPQRSWRFRLTPAGLLEAASLRQLSSEVTTSLRPAPPPPPAPAPVAVAAVSTPRPPAPAAEPTAVPSPAPRPAAQVAAPGPAQAAAEPAPPPPLVTAELGLFLLQRRLSYGGVGAMSSSLQAFEASTIAGPRLRVELYPAARGAWPSLARLGLLVDYATSVGLETAAPTGERRPSRFSRLEAGVTWSAPPLGSLELALSPRLSYLAQRLTVRPAIDGLPDAELSGVTVGLDAAIRLGEGVHLLAGAGWVKWLTAQDLIAGDPAFFPGGEAWALEAAMGVEVALWGPLSLRVLGEYQSTSSSLDPDPTGTYAAASASDRLLGLRAALRARH